MSKFSNALRSLRRERGYTQDDIANSLGVSKSTISMYENGNREPDFETLEAIADFFNVFMSDLIEEKPTANEGDELDEDETLLLNLYRDLSEKERAFLREQARLLKNMQDQ